MIEDFYEIYLEDISRIIPCTQEEEESLLKAVLDGNKSVRERLIEAKLKEAMVFAMKFHGQGVAAGDLIQEANTALIIAVDTYAGGNFNTHMEETIKEAITSVIEEQKAGKKIEEEIAARVNVLKTVSEKMAAELGREATVEELAERMKMTEEDVKNTMKIMLDVLSIGE